MASAYEPRASRAKPEAYDAGGREGTAAWKRRDGLGLSRVVADVEPTDARNLSLAEPASLTRPTLAKPQAIWYDVAASRASSADAFSRAAAASEGLLACRYAIDISTAMSARVGWSRAANPSAPSAWSRR